MYWVGRINKSNIKLFKVLIGLMAIIVSTGSALADQTSQSSLIYIDSVTAGPAGNVEVSVYLRNTETISSISIPLQYDPAKLTINQINFDSSRIDYVSNKQILPLTTDPANGHFWVSAFTPQLAPLAPGDGKLFTISFEITAEAAIGSRISIDSLFFPPGGDLSLVEAGSNQTIIPEFSAGQVMVANLANQSPTIASVADQYILEGEVLTFEIRAFDSDNDDLQLLCTDKPYGAAFDDLGFGTGQLTWQPDFVGPESSDRSPFMMTFWVSDGAVSVEQEVTIHVVNANRRPIASVVPQATFDAGTTLSLSVSATDPDFDLLSWSVAGLPEGATFDYGNPGIFNWPTNLVDTGTAQVTFVATDPSGASDTATLAASINPAALYTLTLDTVSGEPGALVNFEVSLDNQQPVNSFNLLFNYDPSLIVPMGITNAGTRTENFEYFTYSISNAAPGDLKIVGIADNGSGGLPLATGSGAIAGMNFRIGSNLSYSGYTTLVRFVFRDDLIQDDNTLTDAQDVKVPQSEISYNDGFIHILSIGEIKIGDINLNGLAFEISDAIYFSNFYMDPVNFPLNPLQLANSDINQDQVPGTIADLVALINVIVSGDNASPKIQTGLRESALYGYNQTGTAVDFSYSADFEVGGLFMTLGTDHLADNYNITVAGGMTVATAVDNNELRVLVYSLEGNALPAGSNTALSISGLTGFEIKSIAMSSAEGTLVEVVTNKNSDQLPGDYSLDQNYPNPFNPETNISFALSAGANVRLVVYNLLGHEVKILVNEFLSAGKHQAAWDGKTGNGQMASSGVYLYRLEADGESLSRKMLMLK